MEVEGYTEKQEEKYLIHILAAAIESTPYSLLCSEFKVYEIQRIKPNGMGPRRQEGWMDITSHLYSP